MIRVFVGCAGNNEDLESQAVLEWSIRKNTAREVDIYWLQLSRAPHNALSGWNVTEWTTPFSGLRWAVPWICAFEGQAIYTDSDVIFLADIGELWDQPIAPGKAVIAKGGNHGQRLCVSKWDCAVAKTLLPPLATLKREPGKHRQLMQYFAAYPEIVQPFEGGDWNALDLERPDLSDPLVKAVHYTGIPTQPHLKYALPRLAREGGRHWYRGVVRPHPMPELQELFDRLLAEATEAGYGIERYRREPFGEYGLKRYA